MPVEEPPAHILAGSFGPELALILDSAEQAGQGTLAVSDQLEGQAVAFAMADEVLIGEQMFDAAAYLGTDTSAHADARVKDIWRGLLIMGLAVLLLLNVTKQLQVANWWLILLAVLALDPYRRHPVSQEISHGPKPADGNRVFGFYRLHRGRDHAGQFAAGRSSRVVWKYKRRGNLCEFAGIAGLDSDSAWWRLLSR